MFTSAHGPYRGRVGPVYIPAEIADAVEGVFGFDNRVQAKPHFVVRAPGAIRALAATQAYLPTTVARLYGFPPGADGAGECIGILEFGGGYDETDLAVYFAYLGLPNPAIAVVPVDGVTNSPGSDADGEVMLDLEIAASVAPGAKIAVYFAPFTERGWVDALLAAIHDRVNTPSVLSISWGFSEGFEIWTQQAVNAVNDALRQAALLGITVCVASGDDGSADDQNDLRVHADFPATSPYVLACGGTKLFTLGASITGERVWNNGPRAFGGGATGGGVSVMVPQPSWQSAAGVPLSLASGRSGRGVPDVAANADPESGYIIRTGGAPAVIGGTSAAAPLWAALIARLNQKFGFRVGYLNPLLYKSAGQGCRDIVVGSNDTTGQYGGYRAKRGWDACTGFGSPDGAALVALLQSGDTAAPESAVHSSLGIDLRWSPIPGSASDIGVANQGTLWAITPDHWIARWTGGAWDVRGGSGLRVAAAPDGSAWVVAIDGSILQSQATEWQVVGNNAIDISIGRDGSAWATGTDFTLRRFDDGTWVQVAANVARVAAVDAKEAWVVRTTGELARWNGNAFEQAGITALDVGTGGGAVWIVDEAYRLLSLVDESWLRANAYASALSVDAGGMPWIVTLDGGIFAAG
jgi:kumamolisin